MRRKYKWNLKTAPRLGRETWLYEDWKSSLPFNLRTETNNYDLYGAYLSGAKPTLEDDGQYHLPSRDPYTGRILKRPNHPTFRQALEEDHRLGYEPVWRDGEVYTVKRNQKAYGSELPAPLRSPNIYEFAARRAKAVDGKEVKTNNRPRFRKVVQIPGLELGLPANLSNSVMSGIRFLSLASGVRDRALSKDNKKDFAKSSYDDSEEGMSQNSYLMSRSGYADAMRNKGYVYLGNTDDVYDKTYVAKAAKDMSERKGYNIGVWQTQPNDKSVGETFDLIPADYDGRTFFYANNNGVSKLFIDNDKAGLPHAANHPISFKTNSTGEIFIQADDLNDYGGKGNYNLEGFFGGLLDKVGNPHVVTTGPRRLSGVGARNILSEKNPKGKYTLDFMGKESPLVTYLKDPRHNLVLMQDWYPRVGYSMNETVVTPQGVSFMPKQWDHSRMRLGGRRSLLSRI